MRQRERDLRDREREEKARMNLGLRRPVMVKGVKRLDTGAGKSDKRSALGNIGNIHVKSSLNNKHDKKSDLSKEEEKQTCGSAHQKNSLISPKINAPMEVEVSREVEEEAKEAFMEVEEVTVEDIDEYDMGNPQMAAEYVKEIYIYMRKIEKEQPVEADYISKGGAQAKEMLHPKMRAVLVDWLVEVHQQFQLLQETLYLTVAVLDRYVSSSAHNTKRSELQLVGVTAMLIASKYEEMFCPEVADFTYITNNTYTGDMIRGMERKILSSLDFRLGRPLPLHFLRRGSKAAFAGASVHTLAKYIMELAMVQYDLVATSPSVIAAASLMLALRLTRGKVEGSLSLVWTPTLVQYTGYALEELRNTVDRLAKVVATARDNKHKAVLKKYSRKKFMKIALLPQLQFAEDYVKE